MLGLALPCVAGVLGAASLKIGVSTPAGTVSGILSCGLDRLISSSCASEPEFANYEEMSRQYGIEHGDDLVWSPEKKTCVKADGSTGDADLCLNRTTPCQPKRPTCSGDEVWEYEPSTECDPATGECLEPFITKTTNCADAGKVCVVDPVAGATCVAGCPTSPGPVLKNAVAYTTYEPAPPPVGTCTDPSEALTSWVEFDYSDSDGIVRDGQVTFRLTTTYPSTGTSKTNDVTWEKSRVIGSGTDFSGRFKMKMGSASGCTGPSSRPPTSRFSGMSYTFWVFDACLKISNSVTAVQP